MFASNMFTRLVQPVKNFCTASIKFGDPRMPDKLYKSVQLELRSAEPAVMDSYMKFVVEAAKHLEVEVADVARKEKPHFRKFTLLKSARGHRKHLVQYEIRTHFAWVKLQKLTGSTADTLLEYVERMLPEGVALKVTKVALEPLPEHLTPESIQASTTVSS